MSELARSFMAFLFEKHKKTGQNSFSFIEYCDFDGYENAISELSNRGVIENTKDILGTIIVNTPKSK